MASNNKSLADNHKSPAQPGATKGQISSRKWDARCLITRLAIALRRVVKVQRNPVRHIDAHRDHLHEPARTLCAGTERAALFGQCGNEGAPIVQIRELAETVEAAGFLTLDEQAKILGLPRSTAWTIRRGGHKGSAFRVNYQSHASCADASTARSGQDPRVRPGESGGLVWRESKSMP